MSMDEKVNLKLLGKNQEDLKIISAYLQDSILIVKDIVFLKQNRTFVMIVNRFMWEDVEKGVFRQNIRIRCAIMFEEVIKVESKNINQKLILGSSMFGIGWGLIGLCPGPAISSIAFLQPLSILFIISMMSGFYLTKFIKI